MASSDISPGSTEPASDTRYASRIRELFAKIFNLATGGGSFAGASVVHYARGIANGNVANLAAFTVAGDVTFVAGNRVFLPFQTTGSQNGIYVVGTVAAGVAPLTRAADFNVANNVKPGELISVSEGALFQNTLWEMTTAGPIVVGTTALTFKNVGNNSVAGAVLVDADATVQITEGLWRKLPAGALGAARILTLGNTGAQKGMQIVITRLDATANAYTIKDNAAATLFVMVASKQNFVVCQHDGTNWFLKECGMS